MGIRYSISFRAPFVSLLTATVSCYWWRIVPLWYIWTFERLLSSVNWVLENKCCLLRLALFAMVQKTPSWIYVNFRSFSLLIVLCSVLQETCKAGTSLYGQRPANTCVQIITVPDLYIVNIYSLDASQNPTVSVLMSPVYLWIVESSLKSTFQSFGQKQ